MLAVANSTVSLVVAAISGAVAITSLLWQAATQARRQRREHEFLRQMQESDRKSEADRLVRRYRDPLVFAADQLLARIRNIAETHFLEAYGKSEYALASTTFAIAELLCWMEIVRQDQQFLDLGAEEETVRLNTALRTIAWTFSTDSIVDPNDGSPAPFMLWRQEQRAIGEQLIDRSSGAARCIGYASFVEKMTDLRQRTWFAKLFHDAEEIVHDPKNVLPRFQALQRSTKELIDVLDPAGILVPQRDR